MSGTTLYEQHLLAHEKYLKLVKNMLRLIQKSNEYQWQELATYFNMKPTEMTRFMSEPIRSLEKDRLIAIEKFIAGGGKL